jgi:hypothetical protein
MLCGKEIHSLCNVVIAADEEGVVLKSLDTKCLMAKV